MRDHWAGQPGVVVKTREIATVGTAVIASSKIGIYCVEHRSTIYQLVETFKVQLINSIVLAYGLILPPVKFHQVDSMPKYNSPWNSIAISFGKP